LVCGVDAVGERGIPSNSRRWDLKHSSYRRSTEFDAGRYHHRVEKYFNNRNRMNRDWTDTRTHRDNDRERGG